MAARLGKLYFGISVYCSWLERNMQIFHSSVKTVEGVIREIESSVMLLAELGDGELREHLSTGCFVKSGT